MENVDLVHIDRYESFHLTRQDNNLCNLKESGGGISVFLKEGINYKIRYDLNVMSPYMETLFVEVNYDNINYLIDILYRVPNTNVNCFFDKLNELIEPIKNSYELIIAGDFNIYLLKDNIYSSYKF